MAPTQAGRFRVESVDIWVHGQCGRVAGWSTRCLSGAMESLLPDGLATTSECLTALVRWAGHDVRMPDSRLVRWAGHNVRMPDSPSQMGWPRRQNA
ncbi:hypothetical protein ACOMHN_022058 [Nucella lapillus]